ncbi:hypothetical protein HDV00_001567 [Rhizophlyctis rosea]|nr:hypothetical protein HDV00_001567 [Rhizophlyctis rosea]
MTTPTPTQTLKLLDRLLTLLDTHSSLHDKSTQYLDSIHNLTSQRTDTISFLPSPSAPTYHPSTAPAILHQFPDILPRLLAKQTRAIESALTHLHTTLTDIQACVRAMGALKRDAIAKASVAVTSQQTVGPTQISPVEAADWIDVIVGCYEKELAVKQQLIAHLELGSGEGVGTGGNKGTSKAGGGGNQGIDIETVRIRWGLQSVLDFEKETDVRDRVRLMKMMERHMGSK